LIDDVPRARRASRAVGDWTKKPCGTRLFFMTPLTDGVYDVLVVDVQNDEHSDAVRVELVLTAGSHKGEVVRLRVTNSDSDALSLLGLPGSLTVTDGVPSFTPG
jgi:hypothetical protein